MNNSPAWLYGRMHFEDGVRPVLMWRGPKYFHAFFLDGQLVRRRYVLFTEMKYFVEWSDIDVNPKLFKRNFRKFLGKNGLSNLTREMSGATRNKLKEGLNSL